MTSALDERSRRRGAALTRLSPSRFRVEGDHTVGLELVVDVTRETTRTWCREVRADE